MKKRLRLLLGVSAGLLGLAFAAPALGAFQPDMTVQQSSYKTGAATTAGFVVESDPSGDPIAKMTIFSPQGYTSNLGQAPGTTLGKALAFVKAGALGGSILPLTGNVVVGNPADPRFVDPSVRCRQTAQPSQAVWVLDTTLQGQSFQFLDFVNVPPGSPYVVQEICLPSLTDPTNTFQAQLVVANFTVKGVFTNGASRGGYQWAADFTPWGPTQPNILGTIEWRTFVGLPSSLSFKAAKSKRGQVAFSGALAIAGLNPRGVKLHLYNSTKAQPAPNYSIGTAAGLFGTGGKPAATKGIKSNGKYSISRKKPKGKKRFWQMRFEDYLLVPSGGDNCSGPSPSGQPIPCNGTSLAPLTSIAIRR